MIRYVVVSEAWPALDRWHRFERDAQAQAAGDAQDHGCRVAVYRVPARGRHEIVGIYQLGLLDEVSTAGMRLPSD